MEKAVHQLRIGRDFHRLFQPSGQSDLRKLYQRIKKNGCNTVFPTWNLCLLDCFEEYAYCQEQQIPFAYKEVRLQSREEAIAWACVRQLERKDLTAERRKYLIGIQFEAERAAVAERRTSDSFQNNTADLEEMEFLWFRFPQHALPSRRSIGIYIGGLHNIVWNTVLNYAEYARMIERLRKMKPNLAEQILSGQYKLSQTALEALVNMSVESNNMNPQGGAEPVRREKPQERRNINRDTLFEEHGQRTQIASVKDMPLYDPDSEFTTLTYTIPSWIAMIRRVRSKPDIKAGTKAAKKKLADVLFDLVQEAGLLIDVVMEE